MLQIMKKRSAASIKDAEVNSGRSSPINTRSVSKHKMFTSSDDEKICRKWSKKKRRACSAQTYKKPIFSVSKARDKSDPNTWADDHKSLKVRKGDKEDMRLLHTPGKSIASIGDKLNGAATHFERPKRSCVSKSCLRIPHPVDSDHEKRLEVSHVMTKINDDGDDDDDDDMVRRREPCSPGSEEDVFYPDRSSRPRTPRTPATFRYDLRPRPPRTLPTPPTSRTTRTRKNNFDTPKTPRTPKMNINTLTPSLAKRSKMVLTPKAPKARAMLALNTSDAPESLPCRQPEYNAIYKFVSGKIKGMDGGFMYIYGIPGAGKTATVDRVIQRLVYESHKENIRKFALIDINGMHLKRPKEVYRQIWKKLRNEIVPINMAKRLLENEFRTVFTEEPLLLLIDEFDMLFNRTLSVVDTILDWVDQYKLIIVAIANSKDLIEEISKSSTQSRILRERVYDLQFKAYTYQQLQEIIEGRLKGNKVFTGDAIQLLARKSALSGDVRLALNLCRRILMNADSDVGKKKALDVYQVNEVLEKFYVDPKIAFMRSLSKQEQTLLRAIRDVILITGSSTCSLHENVYEQYKALSYFDNLCVKDEFSLFRMLRLLEMYAIITLSESPCTIHTKICLGSNLDFVQIAFPPQVTSNTYP